MNLYQPVHEGFVRYCSARTYGIMETEDLVQETVAIAFERFEGLLDEKAFLAYLMRTANNLFVSQLRRKKFSGVYCENAFEKLKSIAPSAEVAMDVHHLCKAIEKLDKNRNAHTQVLANINPSNLNYLRRTHFELEPRNLTRKKTRTICSGP